MYIAAEENRINRQDKKARGKHAPKVLGLPMGMTKAQRQAKQDKKARKHNRIGVDVSSELELYSELRIWS